MLLEKKTLILWKSLHWQVSLGYSIAKVAIQYLSSIALQSEFRPHHFGMRNTACEIVESIHLLLSVSGFLHAQKRQILAIFCLLGLYRLMNKMLCLFLLLADWLLVGSEAQRATSFVTEIRQESSLFKYVSVTAMLDEETSFIGCDESVPGKGVVWLAHWQHSTTINVRIVYWLCRPGSKNPRIGFGGDWTLIWTP